MVSRSRAFAIACGWIVLALGSLAGLLALVVLLPESDPHESPGMFGSPGLVILVILIWAAILLPIALLGAGIWVARKPGNARTTAGLGAQAAAIGLGSATAAALGFLCLQGPLATLLA
ncbi:protein-S-isoprenylcysteine O-methyltransferase Ste14 [Actinoplanes tereljensis]|uniref:Uncharacterized protein n=1 Tax=Paractinoplanes tereljensis TaxID=571912 RepID=A0A919NVP3_9ACTN|nr:hypothetical protein [Actinoplanes tereljensis]GIF26050.1 hypothetical protein Ate02nite_87800 [Actinoplanes tereljensis]